MDELWETFSHPEKYEISKVPKYSINQCVIPVLIYSSQMWTFIKENVDNVEKIKQWNRKCYILDL